MKVPKPLEQLLAEIRAAIQFIPPPSQFLSTPVAYENRLAYDNGSVSKYLRLEEWSGIKQTSLPPLTSLTDAQLHSLLAHLKQLLKTYNCRIVFQRNLPESVQYRVIRNRFSYQRVPIKKDAYFSFSLCGEKQPRENCIMGPLYCHCALMENFFKKYGGLEEQEQESKEEYDEYILKRRFGEEWQKYLDFDMD